MEKRQYFPEGMLNETRENKMHMQDFHSLCAALESEAVLEARATLCDGGHNLHVDLGCMRGIIPREEGALGIAEGSVRDIALISRVNKPVAFRVTGFDSDTSGTKTAILSRKSVQESCTKEYVSALLPGDVIDARVTHLDSFGAFADIGAGISSLLPIDSISVSRIPHPSARLRNGQYIKAVVRGRDDLGRICLTHKELLGTWEENASVFSVGQTVPGTVRSVEKYGIFVELAPNLAGLAEYAEGITVGSSASVYIKNIIPEKMKIKLIIVDFFEGEPERTETKYFISSSHITRWRYSPEICDKITETVF